MKLIRFTTENASDPCFGVVIQDRAVSFEVLQRKAGKPTPFLRDIRSYLANLPESEALAKELLAWGEQNLETLDGDGKSFPLDSVRLLEPVEVAALYDFGLTPRHLRNSAETLMKYEKDNPQTAPLLQAFAKAILTPKPKAPGQAEPLSYYKCNMNSIVGDAESIPWPAYTSRLDIEPEMAVVYGNEKQPVAGFCIFNDVSARDVQATEFVGGFCLTKDMAKGNQLGPYLVTPDEIGNPYNLNVTVRVDQKVRFTGSTSEISHKAEDVFAWLNFIAPLQSGSVVGFGTIPDCTGCDHDDFIDPGAEIEISIEKLGTLRCRFAEPMGQLMPSRWPLREPLKKYHV